MVANVAKMAGGYVIGKGIEEGKEAVNSAVTFEAKMAEVKSKLGKEGAKLESTMNSLTAGIVELSPRVGFK
ncbi:MAG: hypothetical protein HQK91_14870 [Nitrospirae bacterium]|nr:hypothetical protein [Nitrospirota bacterium]MBF0542721.1 hypothetical protein [Nitrospirota bacterium]